MQAVLRSLLKYHFPNKNFTFAYLDKATAHKKGKFTWDNAMLLFLSSLGFEIRYIVDFDYAAFARRGEKYLQGYWTDEVYQVQKRYSDFKSEQKFASRAIKNKNIFYEKRGAGLSDLRILFQKGYFLMVPINALVVEGEEGYASHIVLVTHITKNIVTYHDPGLPPHANRKVSIKRFLRAMRYPSKESASLIAVRMKK